jgi:hypothetical protein
MNAPQPQSDVVYRLTSNAAPLSYMLPTRNTKRYPLLWYDEKNNVNRSLRYARNQKSPFEDEQDGNAILEPIIFENGFLTVPRTNPALQKFLYYHPLNGIVFNEVDEEKEAKISLDSMNLEVDALIEARKLSVEQLEMVARVLFGKDPSLVTTSELRRDTLIFAKREPAALLNILSDPTLQLQSKTQSLFDNKLLAFRNNQKEVWLNTSLNKRKLLIVPFGDDPMVAVSAYLQTDEGIEILKVLERISETV